MTEIITTLCFDCNEVGRSSARDLPNYCDHCGGDDVRRLPPERCADCGLPHEQHVENPRTGELTRCPDKAFTRHHSPDGHVLVMHGERVGRRRGDY